MKRSYESEPIRDKDVAWDAAHAQKPYWEITAAAEQRAQFEAQQLEHY